MTPNVATRNAPPPRTLPPETRSHIADLMAQMQDHVEHLYVDLVACLTDARRVDLVTGQPMPPLSGDAGEREALVAALVELRQGLKEFAQCRAEVLAERASPCAGQRRTAG